MKIISFDETPPREAELKSVQIRLTPEELVLVCLLIGECPPRVAGKTLAPLELQEFYEKLVEFIEARPRLLGLYRKLPRLDIKKEGRE